MKTTLLVLIIGVLCVAVSARADDNKDAKKDTQKTENTQVTTEKAKAQEKTVKVEKQKTGTYTGRTIRRSGMITDASSELLVLDYKTIQNSGAADIRELLLRKGVSH